MAPLLALNLQRFISQSLEVIKPSRNRTSSPVGIKRAGLNRWAAGLSRRRIQFNPGIVFSEMATGEILSNHLIRPCQHVRRNRQADLFRGFQVDDQLKLIDYLHP
jgi:hypothetical protein